MKMMKNFILSLTALLVSSAVAYAGSYPDITMEELQEAIDDNKVTLIDVNGSDSYAEAHIPGAIDYMEVKGDFATELPAEKDALIVAYCGSPQCGAYAKAADAAKDLGYTNVKHFSQGISGWKKAGADTEVAN